MEIPNCNCDILGFVVKVTRTFLTERYFTYNFILQTSWGLNQIMFNHNVSQQFA